MCKSGLSRETKQAVRVCVESQTWTSVSKAPVSTVNTVVSMCPARSGVHVVKDLNSSTIRDVKVLTAAAAAAAAAADDDDMAYTYNSVQLYDCRHISVIL